MKRRTARTSTHAGTLFVSDIFYSVQGEGSLTGRPMVFVRFSGCDLTCAFCDEPKHRRIRKRMSIDEIVSIVKEYPAHAVYLTGGEPSMQKLIPLIARLKRSGMFVAVETNGYRFQNIANADHIVYSPKGKVKRSPLVREMKFIVDERTDVRGILPYAKKLPVYVQPKARKNVIDKRAVDFCVALVKEHPELRLSLQTHKYARFA
ncbi:MAG: 7-carboxy-7-deazaguanine synthase QueE [Spirochaetota bacterium]